MVLAKVTKGYKYLLLLIALSVSKTHKDFQIVYAVEYQFSYFMHFDKFAIIDFHCGCS